MEIYDLHEKFHIRIISVVLHGSRTTEKESFCWDSVGEGQGADTVSAKTVRQINRVKLRTDVLMVIVPKIAVIRINSR